jgi:hypothetical protein
MSDSLNEVILRFQHLSFQHQLTQSKTLNLWHVPPSSGHPKTITNCAEHKLAWRRTTFWARVILAPPLTQCLESIKRNERPYTIIRPLRNYLVDGLFHGFRVDVANVLEVEFYVCFELTQIRSFIKIRAFLKIPNINHLYSMFAQWSESDYQSAGCQRRTAGDP